MASTRQWFESLAEAHRRAKKRVPRSVYDALLAGAERGTTLQDNMSAFGELGFIPRIAAGLPGAGFPGARDLATTVLGQEVSLPVILSPTGVQAVSPDGEIAVARAAAAARTAMGLSSFASKAIEDVVQAGPPVFFQVYWMGRERLGPILDRARAAGLQVQDHPSAILSRLRDVRDHPTSFPSAAPLADRPKLRPRSANDLSLSSMRRLTVPAGKRPSGPRSPAFTPVKISMPSSTLPTG